MLEVEDSHLTHQGVFLKRRNRGVIESLNIMEKKKYAA